MRIIPLLILLLVAGCQSTTTGEPDRNEKPKKCDTRAADSGACVPGAYDQIF